MSAYYTRAEFDEWFKASRQRQGLTLQIKDPKVIADVVRVLRKRPPPAKNPN